MFVFPNDKLVRVAEAFVGEYASGKSEIAINRALELLSEHRLVTLADLDTVEPFYTIRPLKEMLEKKGLYVVGLSREEAFGLGETGAMLSPQARWVLKREGNIIIDVGYGVHGARTLNLVEGAYESKELEIIAVINYCRPMTNSVSRIKEYLHELGGVDAIVANTHLGDATNVKDIVDGNEVIIEAALANNIPIKYCSVDCKLKSEFSKLQINWPVKYIRRYMPQALW